MPILSFTVLILAAFISQPNNSFPYSRWQRFLRHSDTSNASLDDKLPIYSPAASARPGCLYGPTIWQTRDLSEIAYEKGGTLTFLVCGQAVSDVLTMESTDNVWIFHSGSDYWELAHGLNGESPPYVGDYGSGAVLEPSARHGALGFGYYTHSLYGGVYAGTDFLSDLWSWNMSTREFVLEYGGLEEYNFPASYDEGGGGRRRSDSESSAAVARRGFPFHPGYSAGARAWGGGWSILTPGDDYLVIFGGMTPAQEYLCDVFLFSLTMDLFLYIPITGTDTYSSGTCTTMDFGDWDSGNHPGGRSHFAYWNHSGIGYVFGGEGDSGTLQDMWALKLINDTDGSVLDRPVWNHVMGSSGPLSSTYPDCDPISKCGFESTFFPEPSPRKLPSWSLLRDSYLVMFGGYHTEMDAFLGDFWLFSLHDFRWVLLENYTSYEPDDLSVGVWGVDDHPNKRGGASSWIVDDEFYSWGGYGYDDGGPGWLVEGWKFQMEPICGIRVASDLEACGGYSRGSCPSVDLCDCRNGDQDLESDFVCPAFVWSDGTEDDTLSESRIYDSLGEAGVIGVFISPLVAFILCFFFLCFVDRVLCRSSCCYSGKAKES